MLIKCNANNNDKYSNLKKLMIKRNILAKYHIESDSDILKHFDIQVRPVKQLIETLRSTADNCETESDMRQKCIEAIDALMPLEEDMVAFILSKKSEF